MADLEEAPPAMHGAMVATPTNSTPGVSPNSTPGYSRQGSRHRRQRAKHLVINAQSGTASPQRVVKQVDPPHESSQSHSGSAPDHQTKDGTTDSGLATLRDREDLVDSLRVITAGRIAISSPSLVRLTPEEASPRWSAPRQLSAFISENRADSAIKLDPFDLIKETPKADADHGDDEDIEVLRPAMASSPKGLAKPFRDILRKSSTKLQTLSTIQRDTSGMGSPTPSVQLVDSSQMTLRLTSVKTCPSEETLDTQAPSAAAYHLMTEPKQPHRVSTSILLERVPSLSYLSRDGRVQALEHGMGDESEEVFSPSASEETETIEQSEKENGDPPSAEPKVNSGLLMPELGANPQSGQPNDAAEAAWIRTAGVELIPQVVGTGTTLGPPLSPIGKLESETFQSSHTFSPKQAMSIQLTKKNAFESGVLDFNLGTRGISQLATRPVVQIKLNRKETPRQESGILDLTLSKKKTIEPSPPPPKKRQSNIIQATSQAEAMRLFLEQEAREARMNEETTATGGESSASTAHLGVVGRTHGVSIDSTNDMGRVGELSPRVERRGESITEVGAEELFLHAHNEGDIEAGQNRNMHRLSPKAEVELADISFEAKGHSREGSEVMYLRERELSRHSDVEHPHFTPAVIAYTMFRESESLTSSPKKKGTKREQGEKPSKKHQPISLRTLEDEKAVGHHPHSPKTRAWHPEGDPTSPVSTKDKGRVLQRKALFETGPSIGSVKRYGNHLDTPHSANRPQSETEMSWEKSIPHKMVELVQNMNDKERRDHELTYCAKEPETRWCCTYTCCLAFAPLCDPCIACQCVLCAPCVTTNAFRRGIQLSTVAPSIRRETSDPANPTEDPSLMDPTAFTPATWSDCCWYNCPCLSCYTVGRSYARVMHLSTTRCSKPCCVGFFCCPLVLCNMLSYFFKEAYTDQPSGRCEVKRCPFYCQRKPVKRQGGKNSPASPMEENDFAFSPMTSPIASPSGGWGRAGDISPMASPSGSGGRAINVRGNALSLDNKDEGDAPRAVLANLTPVSPTLSPTVRRDNQTFHSPDALPNK